jgi:hypothetical protein
VEGKLYVCVRATWFVDGTMISVAVVQGSEDECLSAVEEASPDMSVDRRLVAYEGFVAMPAERYASLLDKMDRLFPDEDKGIAGEQVARWHSSHGTVH